MSYSIETTPAFERGLRKFVRKYPELKQRVDQVFQDLHEDPFQPHLRLHQLRGDLRDFHAVRVDYSRRIVLTLRVTERESILVGIGSHDEIYR